MVHVRPLPRDFFDPRFDNSIQILDIRGDIDAKDLLGKVKRYDEVLIAQSYQDTHRTRDLTVYNNEDFSEPGEHQTAIQIVHF